jgi:hypothetical protein
MFARGIATATPLRLMNMSPQQQIKMNAQFSDAPKVMEYDFDKERWAKQMRYPTLDTIIEPDISFPAKYSFAGGKRYFRQWLTMRKILERKPNFTIDELKDLYTRYKTLSHSKNAEDGRLLQRLTTHAEAKRLSGLIQSEVNKKCTEKSWKAMKLGEDSTYSINITSFELLHCYMGNLVKEDWVQLTVKVVSQEFATKTAEPTKLVEYPVFECCLGDGVNTALSSNFIVVGVMNQDGVRYGRDSQDAHEMRKNIARSNRSWFG